MARQPAEVVGRRAADENHDVVSLRGSGAGYRRSPCGGCPWVKENDGDFPAKAFEHSAETSHDASMHAFACHEAGTETPLTCAGFLLRGADHNVAVRLRVLRGDIDLDKVHDDGRELHENYRSMAVANGCSPDSPALRDVRP